jgi:hypothetical protein
MSVKYDNQIRQEQFEALRKAMNGTQTDTSTFVVETVDEEKRTRLVEVSVVLKKPEANLAEMVDAWEILKVERENKVLEARIKKELKAKADAEKKAKKG